MTLREKEGTGVLLPSSEELLAAVKDFGSRQGYLPPSARPHEKMKEVLLHQNAIGPEVHYFMIRGNVVDQKPTDGQNWSGNNITIWERGTVGGEYIKTYGHIHIGELDETYKFLNGKGVALMQRLAVDEHGNMIPDVVEEFRAIRVGEGGVAELFIPAGYGHLVANIGESVLVTQDDSPVHLSDSDPSAWPGHADYELVRQMRGFAYYLVEHNEQPAFVINFRYKRVKNSDFGGIPLLPIPQE